MRKKIARVGTVILLILFALMIILPLIWMVLTGLKTNRELFLEPWKLPKVWQFHNYMDAWNAGIGVYLKNSVIITIGSTIFSTLFACLAAYPISRIKFWTKKLWVVVILGGLMLAPQSAVISLFKMAKVLQLYDSYIGMIIITGAFRIPFATFLLMTFYKGISISLDESAYIDGAKTRQIFWGIIIPLSKPIIASCAIVSFRAVWNDLMFANVLLESTAKKTIPVGLVNLQGTTTTNWNILLAGMVIASVPLIITFLLLQKQFIRGLTAGGVKG
ncbi:ABC transporter permease [Lachnospiraceae bacterium oral taxon 500]|nr:ABC transporter permease [Lachnospiraceae bacterium oral taxon 500]